MKPFPWRPRMAARVHLGGIVSVVTARDGMALCSWAEGPPRPEQPRSAWFRFDLLSPVEDDGATRGAFLDAIREAWGEPLIRIQWSPTWNQWYPYRRGDTLGTGVEGDDRRFTLGGFDAEWDALMAAWEAAP